LTFLILYGEQTKDFSCYWRWCCRFFCAVNAAKMNSALQVIIVEKSNKVLSKVKVSGGGRCNVTHACFDLQELVKNIRGGKTF